MKRRIVLIASIAVLFLGLVAFLLWHKPERILVNDRRPAQMTEHAAAVAASARVTPSPPAVPQLATSYAAQARFPSWSVPITSNNWRALHPDAHFPDSLALQTNDGKELRLSVSMPHATVFPGQAITITAAVGASTDTLARIDTVSAAIVPGNGPIPTTALRSGTTGQSRKYASSPADNSDRSLARFTLALTSDAALKNGILSASNVPATLKTRLYRGSLTSYAERDTWPQSLMVEVTVHLDGQSLRTATPLHLEQAGVVLTAVGSSYIDEAVLRIPVRFRVDKPGVYRIQANLVNRDDNRPVARLTETGKLEFDGDEIVLRCHASVLRARNASGPYELRDFVIANVPLPTDDMQMTRGRSAQDTYPVDGFPLDAYAWDSVQQDPMYEARLRFLKAFDQGFPNSSGQE